MLFRVEGETKFEGYTESESLAKVTALFHDGKSVESITAGQSAVVIFRKHSHSMRSRVVKLVTVVI